MIQTKLVLQVGLAVMLAACASKPNYAPPTGQAAATIKTGLWGGGAGPGTVYISMAQGGCKEASTAASLFSVSNGFASPTGELKVPANQVIAFTYSSGAPNVKACRIAVETILEAGKVYYLIGGDVGATGTSSSLTQKNCRLGINEDGNDKRVADRTCS